MLLKHHRVDLVIAFFARRDLLMLQDGSHLQDEVLMPERPMSHMIFGRPAFRRPNGSPFGLAQLLQTSFFIEMALLQEVEDHGLKGVTILSGEKHTLRDGMASQAALSMCDERRVMVRKVFRMHLLLFK